MDEQVLAVDTSGSSGSFSEGGGHTEDDEGDGGSQVEGHAELDDHSDLQGHIEFENQSDKDNEGHPKSDSGEFPPEEEVGSYFGPTEAPACAGFHRFYCDHSEDYPTYVIIAAI